MENLPKSSGTPLYKGFAGREVCLGNLPHTSLKSPSNLTFRWLIVKSGEVKGENLEGKDFFSIFVSVLSKLLLTIKKTRMNNELHVPS
jgi:hypothetical protein